MAPGPVGLGSRPGAWCVWLGQVAQVAQAGKCCWLVRIHLPLSPLCRPQTTMPGMKRDCGGAAAVLGAFRAAVKQVSGAPRCSPRDAGSLGVLVVLLAFSPGPPSQPS